MQGRQLLERWHRKRVRRRTASVTSYVAAMRLLSFLRFFAKLRRVIYSPGLMTKERETVELSLVIPVYNGSRTIGPLVERIQTIFATTPFEVILVNDGSDDESEMVCSELAKKFPQTVAFVHLSRNFGEHSAVLAGLSHTRGQYVAVLDDDGQNPPEEIMRMLQELKRKNFDVVYGHYIEKKHFTVMKEGSLVDDRGATF